MTYDEAGKILPAVYETVRRERAGMVTRPESWWPHVLWPMTQADKALFVVVHEDAHGARRRVRRRTRSPASGAAASPTARLTVFDIQATNATARAALWQYLLGVDLVATVAADRLPIDEPLRLLLRDPRRARVDFVNDDMWLAPLDPRALLEARRYSVFDGHLVIEVTDLEGRAVRFAVEGNEHAAQCTVTDAAPDVSCSTATLGALAARREPLDAVRGGRLAQEHGRGRLAYADAMFVDVAAARVDGFSRGF